MLLYLACAGMPRAQADSPAPVSIGRGTERVPLGASLLYLEDSSGKLDINSVAALPQERFRHFRGASGDINFGYSKSQFWLALPLALAADAPETWLLEVAFPTLDHVTVYVQRADGRFEPRSSGDLERFSDRPIPHRHFVFPLKLRPGATSTVYIRVSSEGSLTIPVTLWQPGALAAQDQRGYAALGLYYGMLLALGLYNLLIWAATREAAFLAYAGLVFSLAVGMGSFNGVARQFVWPDWPAWSNAALPAGMSLAGLMGALFTRLFLPTGGRFVRLDHALKGMALAFAASAVLSCVWYQAGAVFAPLTGLVFSIIAVVAGTRCLLKRQPGAQWLLLSWTLLLAGVAVSALRNLGWLPTNAFTLHGMQIGSALEMLLLSFALADRLNVMRRDRERAIQEALEARELAVSSPRRSEHDLELRVAERIRELEEANARLRENERALEYRALHDPLTGLANRAMLEDRLGQAIARTRRSGRGCAVLLIDLDGFKSVNDTRGHAAGDELLRQIAERMKDCVRETDTVARLGGDEFVLLLEDLGSPDDAALVADKLIAEASRPFDVGDGLAWIGASIGIAHCPRDGHDGELLLRRADSAMYSVKSDGKKGWKNFSI